MSFLTSCASNNVELPKASIRADKTQIVAPSMSSDFTVSLKANCNWGIIKKDNDAADWLTVTPETGMGNADILNYQLDYFRRILEENKANKGKRIVFIHGKGEGVLRHALVNELRYRYKNYRYQDASFQEYGYGATQVTIR